MTSLPFAPLIPHARAAAVELPSMQDRGRLDGGTRCALAVGTSHQQWRRWLTTGRIQRAVADRAACRLGMHPAEIWGDDWWTA